MCLSTCVAAEKRWQGHTCLNRHNNHVSCIKWIENKRQHTDFEGEKFLCCGEWPSLEKPWLIKLFERSNKWRDDHELHLMPKFQCCTHRCNQRSLMLVSSVSSKLRSGGIQNSTGWGVRKHYPGDSSILHHCGLRKCDLVSSSLYSPGKPCKRNPYISNFLPAKLDSPKRFFMKMPVLFIVCRMMCVASIIFYQSPK